MCAVVVTSMIASAGVAEGHGTEDLRLPEEEIRAYESAVLGDEHAAEHAEERRDERRAMRRWRAMTPREQRLEVARERERSKRLARRTAARAPASEIGRWTQAPFELPNSFAIHTVVLPTGKLLYWGFPDGPPNIGNATLWDPSKGYGPSAFEDVPPPVVDPDGAGPATARRGPDLLLGAVASCRTAKCWSPAATWSSRACRTRPIPIGRV